MKPILILLAGLSAALPGLCQAQPYIPSSDEQIVESLPVYLKIRPEIREWRDRVKSAPGDAHAALQLAKQYIELGRAESDPRYYGYAEAVLTPWLNAAPPLPEALTLRATLFQNRHEFGSALKYLEQALAAQPRQPQAWLTRALIFEVQGQYDAALKSCMPLLKLAATLTSQVCIASTLSLSGQLDQAYRQLNLAMQTAPAAPPQDRQWAMVTLAEMAERMGDTDLAWQHYRQALDMSLRNGYLLATYADFLLDRQRYREVVELLQNETRSDGLLLRLTMAEQQLHLPAAEAHIDSLKARFAAGRLRGDSVHQGDEARFLLHVLNSPGPALELAKANWAVQREPRDMRILLEAALAAGKAGSEVQNLLEFVSRNRLQDARLQNLLSLCRSMQA